MTSSAATAAIAFRPFERHDLALFRRWLDRQHVRARFDPDEWMPEVSANLGADWVRYYIVLLGGRPIGFIHRYRTSAAPPGPWSLLEPGTYGIDLFIADQALLGRGIGTHMLSQFVAESFALPGVERLAIDPDPDNEPARRLYHKIGFRLHPKVAAIWVMPRPS